MKKSHLLIIPALTGALALTGCISSSKTEYVDEERISVAFESPKAEADFYTALEHRKNPPGRTERGEERTSVCLILVNVSHRKITSGPNFDFNLNVRACDIDKNNRISEREAESFLANSPATPNRPATVPDTALKAN